MFNATDLGAVFHVIVEEYRINSIRIHVDTNNVPVRSERGQFGVMQGKAVRRVEFETSVEDKSSVNDIASALQDHFRTGEYLKVFSAAAGGDFLGGMRTMGFTNGGSLKFELLDLGKPKARTVVGFLLLRGDEA